MMMIVALRFGAEAFLPKPASAELGFVGRLEEEARSNTGVCGAG